MNQAECKKVKICSLASGSNGNAYYIEADGQAILVDCGLSCRQISIRAKRQKIDLRNVKAVFVTHEHSDHIRGLRSFCEKYGVDSYMTAGTAAKSRQFYLPQKPAIAINYDSETKIGPFTVYCFEKSHDVEQPCSFRVEAHGISVGVFTDIGCSCEGLRKHLALCHAAFLESNYDEEMLWKGKYPQYLKERVASDRGHLSNVQAAAIVREVNPPHLHTLILSHLSADNNHPLIAKKAFEEFTDHIRVMHASRFEAGLVYEIGESPDENK